MKRYKVGDRFKATFTDENDEPLYGTITADHGWCYKVLYDTRPDVRFNMGYRDTIAIAQQMEPL